MGGTAIYLIALILVSIALISYLVIHPSMTATRAGQILAFVALWIFPVLAEGMGASEHLEHLKSTGFCLSYHAMDDFGKSLHVDDRSYIPRCITRITWFRAVRPATPTIRTTRCTAD